MIKTIEEMPEKQNRITIFAELVNAIADGKEGDMLEWSREDGKKVNINPILTLVEERTNKVVTIVKVDNSTIAVKILNKKEIEVEKKEREQRAKDMKKKLGK